MIRPGTRMNFLIWIYLSVLPIRKIYFNAGLRTLIFSKRNDARGLIYKTVHYLFQPGLSLLREKYYLHQMKSPTLLSKSTSLTVLRIVIGIIMIAHGVMRLYLGTVGGFGEFLNSFGIFIGTPLAWGITIFEVVGGAALALNFFTRWISLIWAVQLLVGIIIVHAQNGWFVVGASTGGMEYSVLLIGALLVLNAHGD